MKRVYVIVGFFLVASLLLAAGVRFGPKLTAATAAPSVVVTVPAQAGAVDGMSINSDQFIWTLFTQFAAPASSSQPSPVVFETWATDGTTFSTTPHWPGPDEPRRFQNSALAAAKSQSHTPIDVPCNPPGNAAVGAFPSGGNPLQCIAEEVKRNRPMYDYIVNNHLNTQEGLADAFKRGFKVVMPTDAIAVKIDWVPVQTMLQWVPQLKDVADVERLYYTTTSGGEAYALVAMHVSSRQNTNWVWGTFEHQMNPGRCDSIGCFDSFGADVSAVNPNQSAVNTQYGACAKTSALKTLMAGAKMSPVWENYCLKSTQVDYTAPDGTPNALGNSVIERITGNGTIAASSCIACHAYASFGANGQPSAGAKAMLPYNPTGKPIPAVLNDATQFDFMWGVLLAPTETPK